jgi:hypothetical protein
MGRRLNATTQNTCRLGVNQQVFWGYIHPGYSN